jgi:hypothetical protein|tara:strand:+ start:115 stop:864 length:750 start_codon:yes stop_codon:yes gene_type:complete
MNIDEDVKQRIKVVGIFFLQSYKILTGTMLSLFIPQSCGDKMCTLTENYNNAEVYHKSLFYCNCFSMFLFICSYLIELRREEWCVKYLDIDNDYPDNCLKEIIRKEKKLDNYMDKVNNIYYNTILVTTGVYAINLGMTIKMIKDNYHSNSTLSCFASFSLLVMMKLYNSLNVAYQSVKNDKMTSAYMSEFVSFNVLDQDYVDEKYKGTKNNKLEDITNLEDSDFKDVNETEEKDESVKVEEIIPIISKV